MHSDTLLMFFWGGCRFFFFLACSSLMEVKTVVPQDMVRHLTACLVLGLEALHSCDVLYRALSPELVFLDSRYGSSGLKRYN